MVVVVWGSGRLWCGGVADGGGGGGVADGIMVEVWGSGKWWWWCGEWQVVEVVVWGGGVQYTCPDVDNNQYACSMFKLVLTLAFQL